MNCGYATLNEAFDINNTVDDNSLSFDVMNTNGKMFGMVTINCSNTAKKLTKFTWEIYPSSSTNKHLKKLKGTVSDTNVDSFVFPIVDQSDYFVQVTPSFSDVSYNEQYPERKHHPYNPLSVNSDVVTNTISETQNEMIYSIFYTQKLLKEKNETKCKSFDPTGIVNHNTNIVDDIVSKMRERIPKNPNLQLRAEPKNPTTLVSPWLQTSIAPDLNMKPFANNKYTSGPVAYDRYMDNAFGSKCATIDSDIKYIHSDLSDPMPFDCAIHIKDLPSNGGFTEEFPQKKLNEFIPICEGMSKMQRHIELDNGFGEMKDFDDEFTFEDSHITFRPIHGETINIPIQRKVEIPDLESSSSKMKSSELEAKNTDLSKNAIINLMKDICSNLKSTNKQETMVNDILEHVFENKIFKEICETFTKELNHNGLTDDENEAQMLDVNLDSESPENSEEGSDKIEEDKLFPNISHNY